MSRGEEALRQRHVDEHRLTPLDLIDVQGSPGFTHDHTGPGVLHYVTGTYATVSLLSIGPQGVTVVPLKFVRRYTGPEDFPLLLLQKEVRKHRKHLEKLAAK